MLKHLHKILFSLSLGLIISNFSVAQQNAFDFDGSNDNASGSFSGAPAGNSARTVEAWIKTTADAIGAQKVIVDWGSMTQGNRFTLNLLWSNSIRIEIGGNGISGTTAVNDGQWHHVAATHDPTANPTTKLYIDGALETSGNFTVSLNTPASPTMYIGRRNDNTGYFDGSLDEIRIWNVAKTQAEIQNNMLSEFCTPPTGLVAYFNFNQGVANASNGGLNTFIDFSGNGNNLSLSGASMNGTSSNFVSGYNTAYQMIATNTSDYTCGSYFWADANQTITGIGNFTHTFTSTSGCDSIVNLFLTPGLHFINETVDTCTTSYTWPVNGTTYATSGTYQEVFTNIHGCDSTRQLTLTIGQNNTSTATVNSCGSYLWDADNQTYTTSGTYTAILSNSTGCDSIITLNLTVDSLDLSVTDQGDLTLITSGTAASYQWLDCGTNTPISGETSATFTATQNGSYACIMSNGSCTDTSMCVVIDYVSTDEINNEVYSFYPNPTKGEIIVQFTQPTAKTIRIFNTTGKVVYTTTTTQQVASLNLSNLTKGIYILEVEMQGEFKSNRFIKN